MKQCTHDHIECGCVEVPVWQSGCRDLAHDLPSPASPQNRHVQLGHPYTNLRWKITQGALWFSTVPLLLQGLGQVTGAHCRQDKKICGEIYGSCL